MTLLLDLNVFWFITLGVLLIGYAILDGFDLGVGILHLFVKKDEEHRVFINSIGPVWDANEVWLVTFCGALFAAFPEAYATIFSGFYLAFMLLLFAMIFRAVAMEFRSKHSSPYWRGFWDIAFCASSVLATFLFGLVLGNSISGIKIAANKEYVGSFLDLLNLYAILIGFFAVSVFALHAAVYLALKTEGELQKKIHGWIWIAYRLFLLLLVFAASGSLYVNPRVISYFYAVSSVWGILILVLGLIAIAALARAVYLQKYRQAFICSSVSIAVLLCLFGATLFPNLAISSLNPEWSLNIYNSASSQKTLGIMQVVCFLGMPLVLAYTGWVYWVFRGKVNLGKTGY